MRLGNACSPCARKQCDTSQSTSRHLDVVRKSLSHHLSLHQISASLGLSLLFSLDDVDDTFVGSAARTMTSRSVAPSRGALDLGHLWWLWGLDTSDHWEGVLERPADDHRPEAFSGEVIVHLLDRVGHVQGVFARTLGAGVLGFVSWLCTHMIFVAKTTCRTKLTVYHTSLSLPGSRSLVYQMLGHPRRYFVLSQ